MYSKLVSTPLEKVFEDVLRTLDSVTQWATQFVRDKSFRACCEDLKIGFQGAVETFSKRSATLWEWTTPGLILVSFHPYTGRVTWQRDGDPFQSPPKSFIPSGAIAKGAAPLPSAKTIAEAMGWLGLQKVILHVPLSKGDIENAFTQLEAQGNQLSAHDVANGKMTFIFNPQMIFPAIFEMLPPEITLPRLFVQEEMSPAQIAHNAPLMKGIGHALDQLRRRGQMDIFIRHLKPLAAVVRTYIQFQEESSPEVVSFLQSQWVPTLLQAIHDYKNKNNGNPMDETLEREFRQAMLPLESFVDSLKTRNSSKLLGEVYPFAQKLMGYVMMDTVRASAMGFLVKLHTAMVDFQKGQMSSTPSSEDRENVFRLYLQFHEALRHLMEPKEAAPLSDVLLLETQVKNIIASTYRLISECTDYDSIRRLVQEWESWEALLDKRAFDQTTVSRMKEDFQLWRTSLRDRMKALYAGHPHVVDVAPAHSLYSFDIDSLSPAGRGGLDERAVVQELKKLDLILRLITQPL